MRLGFLSATFHYLETLTCVDWAWGAAALVYTYEQLGDACLGNTKQLAGFITVVQVKCYF